VCRAPEGLVCRAPEGLMCRAPDSLMCRAPDGLTCSPPDGLMCRPPDDLMCRAPEGLMCLAPEGLMCRPPEGLMCCAPEDWCVVHLTVWYVFYLLLQKISDWLIDGWISSRVYNSQLLKVVKDKNYSTLKQRFSTKILPNTLKEEILEERNSGKFGQWPQKSTIFIKISFRQN